MADPYIQVPAGEGRGTSCMQVELLFREAPEKGKQPHCGFCKQLAAPEGCGSDLIELVQYESLSVESNSLFVERLLSS